LLFGASLRASFSLSDVISAWSGWTEATIIFCTSSAENCGRGFSGSFLAAAGN
jgi:hypothetical protein